MEKWYKFCLIISRAILWPLLIKVDGALPKKGAIVCIANHFSCFDPVLLATILNRRVWFMAKGKIFEWFFVGWLIKKANWAILASGTGPQKQAYKILKTNRVIVVFPEGICNKTSSLLLKFDQGFARFAIKNESPVVPIAIIRRREKFWWLPGGLKVVIDRPIFTNTGITKDELITLSWRKIHCILLHQWDD